MRSVCGGIGAKGKTVARVTSSTKSLYDFTMHPAAMSFAHILDYATNTSNLRL